MKQAIVAITIATIALLLAPAAAWGGDAEDLKAADEAYIAAINKQNIEAIVAAYHDQLMGFSPRPVLPSDWATRSEESRRQFLDPSSTLYETKRP